MGGAVVGRECVQAQLGDDLGAPDVLGGVTSRRRDPGALDHVAPKEKE
jgi:hypothetical protein